MKKNLFRAFLFLLAFLTVIPFTGCEKTPADTAETAPSTTPETEAESERGTEGEGESEDGEDRGPILPEKGYGDSEFLILIRERSDYLEDVYVGEMDVASTALQRVVYQRLSDISARLDVIFDVKTVDFSLESVAESVKVGTDVFDLVVDHGCCSITNAANGYYYDWADLPYVDLAADWWSAEARTEFSTPNGKLFAMLGDISHMSVGSARCTFFNKELIESVPALTSPYELVDTEQWTFDVFEEYVVTLDSNMNGDETDELATDCFGYGTNWYRGPIQLFYSTGNRMLKWRNGEWRITADNDTTNEAVFDMRDLLFSSGAAILLKQDDYSALKSAFTDSRVAFVDMLAHDAIDFAGSAVKYGILPSPKYNSRVKEYYSSVSSGTNLFGVMRNTTQENAERISAVLEMMAYEGHTKVMPLYFDTVLSYQYLKDEDSVRMLHIIHDNLVLDFGGFYAESITTAIRDAIIEEEGPSLSQRIDEARESVLLLLEAWSVAGEAPLEEE